VKYTDPDGRNSYWKINEEAGTIEITIPVSFEAGTTQDQKQAFNEAAKEWEGTYNINGKDYNISVNIWETDSKWIKYNRVKVNTVVFSPEDYSETEGRISNVMNWRDMTIYNDTTLSPRGFVLLLKHEIAHILGIKDKYDEIYDDNGVRIATPPRSGWENNIASGHGTHSVDSRNLQEAFDRKSINKRYYSNW
jgi:hypothetical protein